jgi:hypothetical protein
LSTTPSGKIWNFMQPDPANVDVNDIAQNLSLQVRFSGSCGPYSIAEHSCHLKAPKDQGLSDALPARLIPIVVA